MALEEEILFPSEKSADEFTKFIQKKGFTARKRLKFNSYQEIRAIGSADNLIRWLEDEIANLEDEIEGDDSFILKNETNEESNLEKRDEKNSPESIASPDKPSLPDSQLSFGDFLNNEYFDETEFYDDELTKETELPRLLDLVLYYKELITDCFKNHRAGDEISMITTDQLISEFKESPEEQDKGIFENKGEYQKIKDRFILLFLLKKNDLILEKEEKVFLKDVVEPGNVRFELDATLCDPSLESASNNEITIKEYIHVDQKYLVQIEPDIVLFSDFEELLEWLNNDDLEDDKILEFFSRLIFKQTIVEEIIKFVKEKTKVSKDEIIKNFLKFDLEGREYCHVQTFSVSEEFLREVLHDLNKIHVLEGKDQKIRCSI